MSENPRVRPWNSISGRIVACALLLMLTALGVALSLWRDSNRDLEFLESFRTRDLAARSAAFEMQSAVEAISFRTMGILADAYRAPGSVATLDKSLETLAASWALIREHGFLPQDRQAEIEHRLSATIAFGGTLRAAFKANADISRLFDSWLDVSAPLRKDARAVVAQLDAAIDRHLDEVTQTAAWNRLFALTAGAGVIIIGILAGWFVITGMVMPLARLTRAMNEVATDNTDAEIPVRRQRDEFRLMTEALRRFRDNTVRIRQLTSEQEEMRKRAQADRETLIQAVVARFEADVLGIVDAQAESSADIRATVETLSGAITDTMENASAVVNGAEQVSRNVQAAAAATEQLSASIVEISRRMTKVTEITRSATEQVGEAKASAETLAETGKRIGDVVDLISGIAKTTHLLALNAAIEAERAGNAGRGFAVVAAEVRALALETSRAIQGVTSQIEAVRAGVASIVDTIEGIVTTIQGIDEIGTATTAAVEQQRDATASIARSVDVAAGDTRDVSSAIGAVSSATRQTSQEAVRVLRAVAGLAEKSDALRTSVHLFANQIRAA